MNIHLPNRGALSISGPDRLDFLQGLVTNDMKKLEQAMYACFLTPNGRFLHDFLVFNQDGQLILTPERERVDDLLARLRKYRLRSQVTLEDRSGQLQLWAMLDGKATAHPADPRTPALGQVALFPAGASPDGDIADFSIWDRRRIALGVPDGSRDMIPERGILLENNVDVFNGISWDKGCYMGQELTARTHYRGLVRKRLMPVRITGDAPAFDAELHKDGQAVGEMRSTCGDVGLALLRMEAVQAGDVLVDASGNAVTLTPAATTVPAHHTGSAQS